MLDILTVLAAAGFCCVVLLATIMLTLFALDYKPRRMKWVLEWYYLPASRSDVRPGKTTRGWILFRWKRWILQFEKRYR